MTYDEIKQRLTQVENSLQTLGKKVKPNVDTSYASKSIEQLTTLKESLQKQLAEKEETMFISTKGGDTKAVQMDRKTAMDLKKDPNITGIDSAKGQKLKEVDRLDKNSGIEFGQNETAMIATSAGKALAIALKKAGDELARMKAKRIEPNSFDIHVTIKAKNGDDEFSFYISDDSLHLVDFSFDKELVNVGVKPSGEAIVNVDVLANELLKHFKSLSEKVDDKDTKGLKKLSKALKGSSAAHLDQKKKLDKLINTEEVNEVNYDYYTEPKHFDICPGAKALRDELIEGGKSPEELGEWTFKHDELFKLEKAVLKANKADERHVKVANQLRDEIIHLSRDLGIEAGKIHYLKGHVDIIKDVAAGKEVTEGEGDDHHYIKVPRREYNSALHILDGNIDGNSVKMDIVDNDGAGNVIFYFMFRSDDIITGQADSFMYDAVNDLQAHGVEVVDHSAEMDENVKEDAEEDAKNDADYAQGWHDDPRQDEDTDIGHQDDEPSMLKSSAFETATYAAKLAKKLAQYDQVDGEVDFPNWWQKKLILARDYMSAAYHYLDSEEKQPLIDKLALEHAMNEGTELYDRNGINIKRFSGGKKGLMVQITYGGDYLQVPADVFPILAIAMQSVKNDLKDMSRQVPRRKNIDEIKAAKIQKAHGQLVAKMKELAKQYKAGDKSVVPQLKDLTAKKKELEKHLDQAVAGTHQGQELTELSTEQRNELIELQNILDDVAQKGDEAREIIRQSFPRMLSKADAYGAFEFGSSANRYDTTLESIIEEIEEYYDEEEDDMDEGKYKSDAQRKAIHAKKAELKEFTDNSFTGAELIDNVAGRSPDMFNKQLFADLLPKGVASENDAIEALKKHDKSGIKARMGRYAPMFVHMQYHELEHEGEKYRMHQKQYYNSNFKDKDPDFNPAVSEITLMKVDENDEGKNLGTILVKTDEYVQDLRNLPGLGKRHMEEGSGGQIIPGDDELNEGATCCGRCGRVHVKGSGCKRPYLKGKSHCRNK